MHFYPDVMNRTLVTERPDIYIAGHRSTRQAYFSNDTCKRLARGPAMIFDEKLCNNVVSRTIMQLPSCSELVLSSARHQIETLV